MFHREFPRPGAAARPPSPAPPIDRTDTGPRRRAPAAASEPHWLLRVRPAFVATWLKKWLRVERREVETPFGRFWVDPVSQFGSALVSTAGYEPEMCRTLETFVRPGSVFLDVGANEGFFSVLGSRLVGPRGRVIAIEPQERLAPVIRANLELNACANVSIFSCAISDRHGEADLHLSPDTNTGSTALYQSTRYRLPRVTVPVTTLEDFVESAQLREIDFAKMDIEGFEYEAILGSPRLFESGRIAALALELHPGPIAHRRLDPAEIARLLEHCGYSLAAGAPTPVWVHRRAGTIPAAPSH
jgi:FkbM family methyltransferase